MKILETTVSEQNWVHLTIIPSARMGSESIARMRLNAEWDIDSEPIRARGIIVLLKSN